MTTPESSSAKQRVLEWVRSKNPDSMELKFGCRVRSKQFNTNYVISHATEDAVAYAPQYIENDFRWDSRDHYRNGEFEILGSDMGLQEMLIALQTLPNIADGCGVMKNGMMIIEDLDHGQIERHRILFDFTKNLHSQKPEFYESISPLIP